MIASLSGDVVAMVEVVEAVAIDVDETVTVDVDSCSPKATEEMLERTCFARPERSVVVDFSAEGAIEVAAQDCDASKEHDSGDVD